MTDLERLSLALSEKNAGVDAPPRSASPEESIGPSERMRRILITGAAGKIGSSLRAGLRGAYPVIRLTDRVDMGEAGPGEEVMIADLADLAAVETAVEGVDAIVHFGAIAEEDEWQAILSANIIGTYNIFEAARRQGVKRVVFASSLHVTGFYRCTQRIDPGMPMRPDSRYGVSKAFGEMLASLYADKHGIACVCLRIGTFNDRPRGKRMMSTWISPRDMTQLVRCSLEAPDIHFLVVYGVSANKRSWWDNSMAERLGYAPQDDSERYALTCLAADAVRGLSGTGAAHVQAGFDTRFQGSKLAWQEFSGDVEKIP